MLGSAKTRTIDESAPRDPKDPDCNDVVEELARRCLWESSHRALRRISCCHRDGVLTLRGQLPSYYLKQVTQALVLGVEGVQAVYNYVEVSETVTPIC
jgi:osmotically-inducible protein OsmY